MGAEAAPMGVLYVQRLSRMRIDGDEGWAPTQA